MEIIIKIAIVCAIAVPTFYGIRFMIKISNSEPPTTRDKLFDEYDTISEHWLKKSREAQMNGDWDESGRCVDKAEHYAHKMIELL